MSRMFHVGGEVLKTWNVFVGCKFQCTYCNARNAALTRLKHSPRYQDGFSPHLVEGELSRKFKPDSFVFVGYMGDVAWAKPEERELILQRVYLSLGTRFLFQSRNPHIFNSTDWPKLSNIYYGTTIETNRDYRLSHAPTPFERYHSFSMLKHPHKLVSIEPIMDFDLDVMLGWMKEIKSAIIQVGADNYHNRLPEPHWDKVEALLKGLREICPQVVEKEGLERLKGGAK